MARVVVVLLRQCDDEPKGGLSWMERHPTHHWLPIVLEPSPPPLFKVRHVSVLARVTSANPSHSAMLRVSSPKPQTPKFVGGGPTLLHLHSGLTAQSVTNGVWGGLPSMKVHP